MEKAISFEENLQNLEEIAAALESGKLSLEESLKLFVQGANLAKQLEETLEKARQQFSTYKTESGA
jgi:exodeoxyribonuclease VII small subunit